MTISIWRREDADTTPRGLGKKPTYSIDRPYTSDAAMIWAVEIPCELPEGCTVGIGNDDIARIYDAKNSVCEIFDRNNHPYIWLGDKLVKLSISKKAITV